MWTCARSGKTGYPRSLPWEVTPLLKLPTASCGAPTCPPPTGAFAYALDAPGSAFVPWIGDNLADILCVQQERTVGNDNTVRYHNKVLQIPQADTSSQLSQGYGQRARIPGWNAWRLPRPVWRAQALPESCFNPNGSRLLNSAGQHNQTADNSCATK